MLADWESYYSQKRSKKFKFVIMFKFDNGWLISRNKNLLSVQYIKMSLLFFSWKFRLLNWKVKKFTKNNFRIYTYIYIYIYIYIFIYIVYIYACTLLCACIYIILYIYYILSCRLYIHICMYNIYVYKCIYIRLLDYRSYQICFTIRVNIDESSSFYFFV